jgi:hypothetical protein
MYSKLNKPLLRWIIGGCIAQGMHTLKESISRTTKVFGDRFDYIVCYNNISDKDLAFIARIFPFVEMYQQKWKDCPIDNDMVSSRLPNGSVRTDVDSCGGSLWKLCPPRMRIDSHEIVMDNDIVFFKAITQVEEFLSDSRPMLLKEHSRWFGRYDKLLPDGECFNSGFVGLPPGFDYQLKLHEAWKKNGSLGSHSYDDEQGLITYVLRQENPILVEMNDIIEVHQMGISYCFNGSNCYSKYHFDETTKAAHFVQANRNFPHKPWCKYKNESIKFT